MAQTEETKAIMAKMDADAEKAAKEFPTTGTSKDVSDWMAKWFMKAGYKRLSKIILHAFGH